jgi:hypothetical protein
MPNELITLTPDSYPILSDANERLAIIRQNLDGEPLTAADLDRIRLPKGDLDKMSDRPCWVLETSGGEIEMESFRCVIIHTQCRRAYYKSAKPVEGTPPDCASADCKTGQGSPGGDCDSCPLSQWKSAQGGTGAGQACRKSRVFIVLREGEFLPEWFSAPPTSLRDMRSYLQRLGRDGFIPPRVITEFSLKKGKSSVIVVAKNVGVLDEATFKRVLNVKNDYSQAADSLNRDYSGEETVEV